MAAMAAAGWVAEVPLAADNPRKGVDLARCIIQHGLWDAGTNQAVLLDTSAFAPGVYSMLPGASSSAATGTLNEAEDEGRSAEAVLEVLGQLCHELGPEAHCVLICERRRLHGVRFRQSVWSSGGPLAPDEAMKRVHIKYVLPPAALGDTPPLVEVLAGLQNLTFAPVAIAILGLTMLTRAATSCDASAYAPGVPSNPAACYVRPGLFGAAAADARHFALGAALLVDAVAQASSRRLSADCCRALLWDDAAPPEGSAQAVAQLGLLGSSFDGLWNAGWKVAMSDAPLGGTGATMPFAEQLGRNLPCGRL